VQTKKYKFYSLLLPGVQTFSFYKNTEEGNRRIELKLLGLRKVKNDIWSFEIV
jgi:hypothetical protein